MFQDYKQYAIYILTYSIDYRTGRINILRKDLFNVYDTIEQAQDYLETFHKYVEDNKPNYNCGEVIGFMGHHAYICELSDTGDTEKFYVIDDRYYCTRCFKDMGTVGRINPERFCSACGARIRGII